MRGTISGKSSSSGSYSIGGSNPNVTEAIDDKTPTEKILELPERSESIGKEDKTTTTVHEKEQLVPKMMVIKSTLSIVNFNMSLVILNY